MSSTKHTRDEGSTGVVATELNLDNPHDLGRRPSRLPGWAQWGGVTLLVAVVVMSALWAATDHWRRATFALGVGLLWLAVLRLTCDSKIVGILAVRSVRFDTLFCTVVGGMMVFLSASVDALGS